MRGFEVAEAILSALSHLDAPSSHKATLSQAVAAVTLLARAAKRALMHAYEDVRGDSELCEMLADSEKMLIGFPFAKHEIQGLYEVLCIYPQLSRTDLEIAQQLSSTGSVELELG